jgi:hypothetical protein
MLTTLAPGGFEGLDGLKELVVVCTRGCVEAIGTGSLRGLANLNALTLGLADLTAVAAGAFRHCPQLKSLAVSGSRRLVELPDGVFAGISGSLEALQMSGLGLRDVRSGLFAGLGRVTLLSMTCFDFWSTVSPNTFAGLPSCERLIIASSAIRTLGNQAFAGLMKLEQLEVSGNRNLSRLETGTFDQAFDPAGTSVYIDLRNNGWKYLSPHALVSDGHSALHSSTIMAVSSMAGTALDVCCSYEWLLLGSHWVVDGLACINHRAAVVDRNSDGGAGAQLVEPRVPGAGFDENTAVLRYGNRVAVIDQHVVFGCCFEPADWKVQAATLGTVNFATQYSELSRITTDVLALFCTTAAGGVNPDPQSCTSTQPRPQLLSAGTTVPATDLSVVAPDNQCPPEVLSRFESVWVPPHSNQDAADIGACSGSQPAAASGLGLAVLCPDGYRLENIGRKHNLDCEPWSHPSRSVDIGCFGGTTRACCGGQRLFRWHHPCLLWWHHPCLLWWTSAVLAITDRLLCRGDPRRSLTLHYDACFL